MTTAAKFKKGDVVVVGGALATVCHEELTRTEHRARVYRVRVHNSIGPDTFVSAAEWWIQRHAHVNDADEVNCGCKGSPACVLHGGVDRDAPVMSEPVECTVRFSNRKAMSKFLRTWADRCGHEVRDDERNEDAELELYFIGQDDCDRAHDIANEIAGVVVE